MKKFKSLALFIIILSALSTGCSNKTNNNQAVSSSDNSVAANESANNQDNSNSNNSSISNEENEKLAKTTVNDFLTKYKNKNIAALNALTENNSCPFNQMYVADNKESNLIFDTITQNLSYEITSIEIKNSTATVNLKLSNINMADVMSNAVNGFLEIGSQKVNEPNFNADDLLYQLIEQGVKENGSKKENFTATFDLVKNGDNWLISESQGSTDFYDVISGRYYAYTVSASQTMSMLSGEGDK